MDDVSFKIPPDWSFARKGTCQGVAMAAPSRVRTSCPPQPSVTVFDKSTFSPESAPDGSLATVAGHHVVLVVGAGEEMSRQILRTVLPK